MVLVPEQENELARAIQAGVPLVPGPFAALGEAIGESEAAVLETLRAWAEAGTLREISAVVEGSMVGYESALAAAKVPPHRLKEVVAIVNAHPTVTHNYERDHPYNLWFTLAVPHAMGLERTAALLARATGLETLHMARRTATFKIGVNIDLLTLRNRTEAAPKANGNGAHGKNGKNGHGSNGHGGAEFVALSEGERATLRALQQPLPLTERPFAPLAEAQGIDPEQLLEFGKRHLGGMIRRYSGVMRHRKLGVRSNGMVVWNVPDDRLEEVGNILAQVPEVSHCYAREPLPDFPYTLYTMVHAPDPAVLEAMTGSMADKAGVSDYRVLVSTREFKKVRLRYFLRELEAWWREHGGEEMAI